MLRHCINLTKSTSRKASQIITCQSRFNSSNSYLGGSAMDELEPSVVEKIRPYAQKRATSKSLHDLYVESQTLNDETRVEMAQFVWNELPIRISHRITELTNLPYSLSFMPSIRHIRDLYINSFLKLVNDIPCPQTPEDDEKFSEFVAEHLNNMKEVIPTVANGIREMREYSGMSEKQMHECPFINDFLDRFFLSRVGTRVLTTQYVTIHRQPATSFCVGIIDSNLSPKKVCQRAVNDASDLCTRHFGSAPEVYIRDDHNLTFKYLEGHLHHMVFELVKNCMRATCELYPDRFDDELPPINIVMVPGETEITIKISDEGGGIARDSIDKIWLYSYTTANNGDGQTTSVGQQANSPVFAGYGYGLPLSRLYARYFGGDLKLVSMEGHGTDAYLYLSKLGDAREPLPYPFDNPGIYIHSNQLFNQPLGSSSYYQNSGGWQGGSMGVY